MNKILIVLIVIFLPGIIATIISDKLTIHSKWNSFKFSLYSLMLGILSYATLQALIYIFNILSALPFHDYPSLDIDWYHLTIWNSALSANSDLIAWEIFLAVILSIPVAFFASWLINFKVFNKIGQKFNVTTKYGDENLFSYYLNAEETDWIYVRDIKNNLTYQGRILSHSENENVQELVLSEVSVYRYIDSAFFYNVPTIYLSRERGELIIEAVPNEILGGNNE